MDGETLKIFSILYAAHFLKNISHLPEKDSGVFLFLVVNGIFRGQMQM